MCAERGGVVHSALDRDGVRGTLAIRIAKAFDYINQVSYPFPLSDLQGYMDLISPLLDDHQHG